MHSDFVSIFQHGRLLLDTLRVGEVRTASLVTGFLRCFIRYRDHTIALLLIGVLVSAIHSWNLHWGLGEQWGELCAELLEKGI